MGIKIIFIAMLQIMNNQIFIPILLKLNEKNCNREQTTIFIQPYKSEILSED